MQEPDSPRPPGQVILSSPTRQRSPVAIKRNPESSQISHGPITSVARLRAPQWAGVRDHQLDEIRLVPLALAVERRNSGGNRRRKRAPGLWLVTTVATGRGDVHSRSPQVRLLHVLLVDKALRAVAPGVFDIVEG